MLFWIGLAVPTLIATWAAYWWSGVSKFLNNFGCRTVCLVCPTASSLVLLIVSNFLLNRSGADLHWNEDATGKEISAYLLATSFLLLIFTLLVASLVGMFRKIGRKKPVLR